MMSDEMRDERRTKKKASRRRYHCRTRFEGVKLLWLTSEMA